MINDRRPVCFIWVCPLQAGNAELFNSYLQSLKRSIPDRGLNDFWGLLAQGSPHLTPLLLTHTLILWGNFMCDTECNETIGLVPSLPTFTLSSG